MLREMDTALCIHKMTKFPDSVALPANIVTHINVTLGWDNIDRLEETLTGAGTSHRVHGLVVQQKVFGPFLPSKTDVIKMPKPNHKSISIEDQPIPLYNAGNQTGPPSRTFIIDDYSESRKESWQKTLSNTEKH